MPPTKDFDEIFLARLRRDAGCRLAMLEEIRETIASEELELGKSLLRDVAEATGGFAAVGESIGASAEDVERMLGAEGNPGAGELLRILACLQEREGARSAAANVRSAAVALPSGRRERGAVSPRRLQRAGVK